MPFPCRVRRMAVIGAATALALIGGVGVATPALAATGSAASPLNLSDNPALADNPTGWSTVVGGSAVFHDWTTDHVAAKRMARVTSSGTTTRLRMPSEPVTAPGGPWTYAADVKATRPGAKASVTVEWLTAAGSFISYDEGTFVTLSSANWTRTSVTATPPAGAATGRSQVNVINTSNGQAVRVTQHDVRAPAVQIFTADFETGNFTPWRTCQTRYYNGACSAMPAGGYSLTTGPGHQGRYAGRFEVREGDAPDFCCGERAQAVYESAQPIEAEGADLWYDWAFMIDPTYPDAVEPNWQVLMQWHSHGDGAPPLGFYTNGGYVELQTRGSGSGDGATPTAIWRTPYTKGRWTDIKLHIRWSADPNVGKVEIWKDGVAEKFTADPPHRGAPCRNQALCRFSNIYTGDPGNRAMLGYYRDPEIAGTGIVHHDNFVIATTESALNSSR